VLVWVIPGIEVANPFLRGLVGAAPKLAPILVLVLGLAALLSAFGAWRRRRLLESQAAIEDVRKLSWQDFERLVGEAYRRKGYSVIARGLGGADGGADIDLYRGDEHLLVQCKQWKAWKVGVKPVRELLGVVTAEQADGGIFVTSGRYTREALRFARDNKLVLVDGETLLEMIWEVQVGPSPRHRPAGVTTLASFVVPVAILLGSVGHLLSQAEWLGIRTLESTMPEAAVMEASVPDHAQRVRAASRHFTEEYVTPEGCVHWRSDRDMVNCTNHLMRARREFLQRHPEYEGVRDWEL